MTINGKNLGTLAAIETARPATHEPQFLKCEGFEIFWEEDCGDWQDEHENWSGWYWQKDDDDAEKIGPYPSMTAAKNAGELAQ